MTAYLNVSPCPKTIPGTAFTRNVPHDEAYGKGVIYDSRRTLLTESEVPRIINRPEEKSSKYTTNKIKHELFPSEIQVKIQQTKSNSTLASLRKTRTSNAKGMVCLSWGYFFTFSLILLHISPQVEVGIFLLLPSPTSCMGKRCGCRWLHHINHLLTAQPRCFEGVFADPVAVRSTSLSPHCPPVLAGLNQLRVPHISSHCDMHYARATPLTTAYHIPSANEPKG